MSIRLRSSAWGAGYRAVSRTRRRSFVLSPSEVTASSPRRLPGGIVDPASSVRFIAERGVGIVPASPDRWNLRRFFVYVRLVCRGIRIPFKRE
jgi:hypothetical protein